MAETPAPTLENELLSGTYTDEEKAEILGEIEVAAQSAHMQAATVIEAFRPTKRGVLFPVLINVFAVVLVVGAWFGAQAYFSNRQEDLKIKTSQLFGAEATLLAKVLADSKAELDAKNAEIGNIQANLDKMAQEKNSLVANFDSQLSAKETALKAELATQLEAEKKRLQGSGISQIEIQQKLNEFEALKNAEATKAIDGYKKQAQLEIETRTTELVAMQAKLQSTQAEQDKLKVDLEKKTAAREKDLQGQLSSQSANLDKLTRDRDELNLFFRQTDAQYASVRNALEAGDFAKAQTAVGLLKGVLNTANSSTSDVVRQRAAADLILAGALDRSVGQLVDASKKSDVDPKFEAFKAAVKKAQAAPAEERPALMSRALAAVPEVDAAVTVVQAWESQKALGQLTDKLKAAEDLRQSDVAALTQTLAERQTELEAVQAQVDDLKAQAEWYDRSVEETVVGLQTKLDDAKENLKALRAEKATWKSLTAQYEMARDQALAALLDPKNPDFAMAKSLFLLPFQSDAGKELFPDYVAAFSTLTEGMVPLAAAPDTAKIRGMAFADVLQFTDYLQGTTTGSVKDAQATTEKLTRSEDQYKKVVDAIQTLVKSGAKESILKTDKFKLFGSVISRSGTHLVMEPLTKAAASVGQAIEVRRSSSKGETALARGVISAVSAKKTEADLDAATAPRTEPAAGDTVYLILN